MSIAIVEVDDTEEESFIQEFSLAEKVFFEDRKE